MTSLNKTASWVICRKDNDEALFETFSAKVVKCLNKDRYYALPILEHLDRIQPRQEPYEPARD